MEEAKPTGGATKVPALLRRASDKLPEIEQQATSVAALVELFMPFLWDNRYVFRCDNTRSVYRAMRPEDRARIPWDPETINWREDFLEVHLPGLEKWVLPGFAEETERRRGIAAHRDLLEPIQASGHALRRPVG